MLNMAATIREGFRRMRDLKTVQECSLEAQRLSVVSATAFCPCAVCVMPRNTMTSSRHCVNCVCQWMVCHCSSRHGCPVSMRLSMPICRLQKLPRATPWMTIHGFGRRERPWLFPVQTLPKNSSPTSRTGASWKCPSPAADLSASTGETVAPSTRR